MNNSQQLPLFGENDEPEEQRPPTELDKNTPIEEALEVYIDEMRETGKSIHTVKAFKSDIGLLARWAGLDKPVGEFGTNDLNRFLHWMLVERDRPCSPKTYARRVTALKNFFRYLYDNQTISTDPSNAVIQRSVRSPLPMVLSPDEIDIALGIGSLLRSDPEKPDARPLLLVQLILETGIKKAECMAIHPEHIDRKSPDGASLWVRYDNSRMRYKERRIMISYDLLDVLDEYMLQRRPENVLFECTPRNLEYVLRDIADTAGLPRKKLSFETLRWTCALTDYVNEMEEETLRRKLGLSRITWRETHSKLGKLMTGERQD